MKTALTCLPCFFGQVERSLRYAGVNGSHGRRVLRAAAAIIESSPLDQIPARTTTLLHRLLRRETGVDPYSAVKREYNRIAADLLPDLRGRAASCADPLEGAARAAIAGNVIDFGIYDSIDLDRSLDDAFRLPLSAAALRDLRAATEEAESVLFLCDNAGEIAFDRILLEHLRDRGKRVTAVVKGSPVINDATLDDAREAGLFASAEVIDNGSDGIGTLLESCGQGFRERYEAADLIISKGQANFETLAPEEDPRIFFLFKIKCPVVAEFLGRPEGDIVLSRGGPAVIPVGA